MDERGQVPVGGDPQVRSPEMLRGGRGSVRSDIYSAGVTMYRLLTGSWPVEWPGDFGVLRQQVLDRAFDDLGSAAPHVPWPLVRIVRTAMEAAPADRFVDAAAMNLALSRVDLGRRWARIPTHPGHVGCWCDAPNGKPSREVCVSGAGRRFSIVTRRAGGRQNRVVDLCLDDVAGARLPVELRRVFTAD
jgi:serine/threonine-protein kinase